MGSQPMQRVLARRAGQRMCLTPAACLATPQVGYLHYWLVVIDQVCAFLDINCLTIKKHSAEQQKVE
jgi:hypothetical protein